MIDGVFVCAPQILLLVLYLVMYCFYLHITLEFMHHLKGPLRVTHMGYSSTPLASCTGILHPLVIFYVKVKVQISEPHLAAARVSKACVELDFC